MKLYYSPGACSLSPHIALREAGLAFDTVLASTKTHKLADGADFYAVNSLGYVPVLELDDGRRLREGPAIVQYIADQAPDSHLAPAHDTFERYQLQEWLNFIGTELHKSFSPLFRPDTPAQTQASTLVRLKARLVWVDGQLQDRQYLMGAHFTVADGYLFTVTNWAPHVGLDLSGLAQLMAWRDRVGTRPAVIAAMKAEGLLK